MRVHYRHTSGGGDCTHRIPVARGKLFPSELPEETSCILSSRKHDQGESFVSSFVKVWSALGFMCNDPQGEESAGMPGKQSFVCFLRGFLGITLGRREHAENAEVFLRNAPPAKRALLK